MFDPAFKNFASPLAPDAPAERRSTVLALHSYPAKSTCSNCNSRDMCLPSGLKIEEMDQIDLVVDQRRHVKKGGLLFHSGDRFAQLFAIRSGFFKSYIASEDGSEQVTGFQMAGDVLGLDGIASEHHTCNAVALEDSEVCLMPFNRIQDLSRTIAPLQRHVHRIMSREIVRENDTMLLLGSMRSEARLASFLLNLVDRMHARGFSQSQLVLRMTREEIGSYLGLKLETVSRVFSKFAKRGLVDVDKRNIAILRSDLLRAVVHQPKRRGRSDSLDCMAKLP